MYHVRRAAARDRVARQHPVLIRNRYSVHAVFAVTQHVPSPRVQTAPTEVLGNKVLPHQTAVRLLRPRQRAPHPRGFHDVSHATARHPELRGGWAVQQRHDVIHQGFGKGREVTVGVTRRGARGGRHEFRGFPSIHGREQVDSATHCLFFSFSSRGARAKQKCGPPRISRGQPVPCVPPRPHPHHTRVVDHSYTCTKAGEHARWPCARPVVVPLALRLTGTLVSGLTFRSLLTAGQSVVDDNAFCDENLTTFCG